MEHVKQQLLPVNNVKHCAAIFMMFMIHFQNYTTMELYIALLLVEKTMHYEMILFAFLKDEDNLYEFGVIDLFISGVDPTALVYKMIRLDNAILQQAGHPCRYSLLDYQECNLLGRYVVPVEYQTRSLTKIQIDNILGKAVIVVPAMQLCNLIILSVIRYTL